MPQPDTSPAPLLRFFQRIRLLAAKLDAMEEARRADAASDCSESDGAEQPKDKSRAA